MQRSSQAMYSPVPAGAPAPSHVSGGQRGLNASATVSLMSAIVAVIFGVVVLTTDPSSTSRHAVLDFAGPPGSVEDGKAVVYNKNGLVRASRIELSGTVLSVSIHDLNRVPTLLNSTSNTTSIMPFFDNVDANQPRLGRVAVYGALDCPGMVCTGTDPVLNVGFGIRVLSSESNGALVGFEDLARTLVADPSVPEPNKVGVYVSGPDSVGTFLPVGDGVFLQDGTAVSAAQLKRLESVDSGHSFDTGALVAYGADSDVRTVRVNFTDPSPGSSNVVMTAEHARRLVDTTGTLVSYDAQASDAIHVHAGGLVLPGAPGAPGATVSVDVLEHLATDQFAEPASGQFVRFGNDVRYCFLSLAITAISFYCVRMVLTDCIFLWYLFICRAPSTSSTAPTAANRVCR